MKVEYGLLVLVFALLCGLLKQFLPDFPLDDGTVLVLGLYILAKLGVEIVNKPLRALVQKMLVKFAIKRSK